MYGSAGSLYAVPTYGVPAPYATSSHGPSALYAASTAYGAEGPQFAASMYDAGVCAYALPSATSTYGGAGSPYATPTYGVPALYTTSTHGPSAPYVAATAYGAEGPQFTASTYDAGARSLSNHHHDASSPGKATKTHRITREPPSPDPTPNLKHVKTSPTELDYEDGSNKENIPPDPIFDPLTSASAHSSSLNSASDATTSASATTPGPLRASQRTSAQVPRHTLVSRSCGTSARPRNDASSSLSDTPVSRREGQVQSSIDTPTRAILRPALATPPPTPELMPPPPPIQENKPTCLYTQARALLRPQANENVRLIDNFTSLNVSGAPGTGKTALINEILSSPSFVKDKDATDAIVRIICY
ncbi:hypothetical protein JB92DRAFT_3134073 [Gautieria morchelliformis]|nr:hypothetical protein JB92DRAFT_3134073 [Gautieria morchelliformis]